MTPRLVSVCDLCVPLFHRSLTRHISIHHISQPPASHNDQGIRAASSYFRASPLTVLSHVITARLSPRPPLHRSLSARSPVQNLQRPSARGRRLVTEAGDSERASTVPCKSSPLDRASQPHGRAQRFGTQLNIKQRIAPEAKRSSSLTPSNITCLLCPALIGEALRAAPGAAAARLPNPPPLCPLLRRAWPSALPDAQGIRINSANPPRSPAAR